MYGYIYLPVYTYCTVCTNAHAYTIVAERQPFLLKAEAHDGTACLLANFLQVKMFEDFLQNFYSIRKVFQTPKQRISSAPASPKLRSCPDPRAGMHRANHSNLEMEIIPVRNAKRQKVLENLDKLRYYRST